MDIPSISGLTGLSGVSSLDNVSKFNKIDGYADSILKGVEGGDSSKTQTFDSLLQSAMDMINETNQYTNEAAEAEMAYALGITNSTHDLQTAQMKANISLQYTVAVRNAVMDAYKEIMQIQF